MIHNDETRLTVLSVAYPFSPVGADAVGGAEQILSQLDRALVAAGHSSLVVACEGSQTAGRLFPVPIVGDDRLLGPLQRRCCTERLNAAIHRALLLYRVDLIHMHGLDFYQYELPSSIPTLVTLHLPIPWYGIRRLGDCQSRVHLCCVSESQRRSAPPELGDLPVIENGVELPPWPPQMPRENFALVLGRICPEKNIHAALRAGDRAGMPVLVAGRVFPYAEHQAYFHGRVMPLLDPGHGSIRHQFLGPVGAAQRQELLSRARCLLHPTVAPETSSLVAMEALAAGTPVIAYRSGALPDIVENGVTGFLVDGVEEMAEAIRRVDSISPQACRRAAEQRFGAGQMTAQYLQLYRALVHQNERNQAYA